MALFVRNGGSRHTGQAAPPQRNIQRGENNFASSWEVLSADSKSFNEAKEKLKFFESEGVKCCCIINTYADASDETEAGAVARMFRLMYGMDMV